VFAIGLIIALALINSSSSRSSVSYSQPQRSSGSGSSALIDSERFASIQSRYEKLAQEFEDRKDYTKAAHIYMKLLKNRYKAAEVLEKGELYSEAAAIHLKYLNNKPKAAECYEKGHVYKQAIELYRELNQHEKVGDLYTILKDKPEADKYYGRVIEEYKGNGQYVKASFIYKDKIKNIDEAQEVLLTGWKNKKDAANCLNNYFANIKPTKKLSGAITSIYNAEVTNENSELFLQVMKQEFKKHQDLEELTKNIAYEIVADKISTKPEIASELISFNPKNKSMIKDVMKYKLKKK
jgi:tetratricopeptide (TPR) repeat protein